MLSTPTRQNIKLKFNPALGNRGQNHYNMEITIMSVADAALASAIETGDEAKIKKAAQDAFGTHQWADQTINILRGCE